MLIGSLSITIFGVYVFSSWIKSDQDNQQQLFLIRANNAFQMQHHEQANIYFEKAVAEADKDVEVLYRYIQSLLSTPEKSLTKIIEVMKIYLGTSEGIKSLNFNTLQQMRAMGMMNETLWLSEQLDNPLHKALLLIDHDLDQAQLQLQSVNSNERDVQFYAISSEIHFLLHDHEEAINDTDVLLTEGFADPQVYYYRAQALARTGKQQQSIKSLDLYQILTSVVSDSFSQQVKRIQQLIAGYPVFGENIAIKVRYINALQSTAHKHKALDQLRLISVKKMSFNNKMTVAKTAMRYQHNDIMMWLYQHFAAEIVTQNDKVIVFNGLLCQYFVSTNQFLLADRVCVDGVDNGHHFSPMLYWSGELMLKRKKLNKAILLKKSALRYAPWMRQWRMELAHIYLAEGQLEQARSLFDERMVEMDEVIKRFVFENGLNIHE